MAFELDDGPIPIPWSSRTARTDLPTEVPRRVRRSKRLPQRSVWPEGDPKGPTMVQPSRDPEISPERAAELCSMPYPDYLKTLEWDSRRLGKILAAGKRCQICNSPGPLEVHHRTYERRGAERWMDLTVLCDLCHGLFSEHGRMVEE